MDAPLTLRLPFWLADDGFRLELLLSFEDRPWARTWPLVEAFALSAPEKKFARKLLALKRNHWLYRCNQRSFCGDFVWVDMSSPRPEQRRAAVIELKHGADLQLEAGGLQLQNASSAIDEIAQGSNTISTRGSHLLVGGDEELVFEWLADGGR